MAYELWDIQTGNLLGYTEDEEIPTEWEDLATDYPGEIAVIDPERWEDDRTR